jgi:quercetin dioxygenase-like cupin family protein
MKAPLATAFLLLGSTTAAVAQDPVKVDPKHYQVLFEDAQIRVLRITYGANEKSVMHEHPVGNCVVLLTAGQMRMHTPDGKFTDGTNKAGDVNCTPPGPGTEKHNPENVGGAPFSAVIVERKSPKP